MTVLSKIDSNSTGLAFAEETSVGVLPVTPIWYPLEPNEYGSFGGKVKTVARRPINQTRQRKKGVVVDVDAAGDFTMDVTADNTQRLMQGFLFANARTKNELSIATVGTDYQPTSGGAGFFVDDLIFAKGFADPANNGLKQVATAATSSVTVVGGGLVAATGQSGIISRVGHQFGTGVAAIDASGTLPKLTVSGIVAASSTFTITGQPANNETVTVGGKTYTFQTTLTNVDGNVKIAATAALSLTNLYNAINLTGGVPGTDYATAMTANTQVTAGTLTATTFIATAQIAGTVGNSIATTDTYALGSWTGATLSGGTGISLKSYGVSVGEWVCIGDDTTITQFATAANNGLKRIRVLGDNYLTFDKSTLSMVTDAGTGKTIRLIMGRAIKNEQGSLIVRKSYQFERTLGAPDDASPNAVQAEYLTGCIADQLEINVKQADKVTAKLSFLSKDYQTRNAGTGVKSGTRLVLQEADAYNSTSHVVRASLAVINPLSATPSDLFAYMMDLQLTINNNVSPNKAVKVLGAFDNTAGTFEVDASMTAYFASVDALATVRNNSDVTLDFTFAAANKGLTFDLPLVSVGDALADVKQDTAIMVPIKTAAATGSKLDTNLNHTLMTVYWDYLPTLAA